MKTDVPGVPPLGTPVHLILKSVRKSYIFSFFLGPSATLKNTDYFKSGHLRHVFIDTVSGFLYRFPLSFLQPMISSSKLFPSDESTKSKFTLAANLLIYKIIIVFQYNCMVKYTGRYFIKIFWRKNYENNKEDFINSALAYARARRGLCTRERRRLFDRGRSDCCKRRCPDRQYQSYP